MLYGKFLFFEKVEGVDSHGISDHFVQFIEYTGGLKPRRSLFHLIWFQCVWVWWNERNDRLFRNRQSSIPLLLDKVKSHTLWWLKASNVVFNFGTHMWWSSLLLCMSIDWLWCNSGRILIFSWLLWHVLCFNNYGVHSNIFLFCFLKKNFKYLFVNCKDGMLYTKPHLSRFGLNAVWLHAINTYVPLNQDQ